VDFQKLDGEMVERLKQKEIPQFAWDELGFRYEKCTFKIRQ
jgi:hypothetical protein